MIFLKLFIIFTKIGWNNVWIPIAACLLIACCKVSPIYIIIIAGVAGWLYGKLRGRN